MPDLSSQSEHVSDVDTALLDVELFIKYQAPERAIKRLRAALEANPRSIALRERMREICIVQKQKEEAARQCLALARLYIERDEFDDAYDRLLEAKQLDARINIAGDWKRFVAPAVLICVPKRRRRNRLRSPTSNACRRPRGNQCFRCDPGHRECETNRHALAYG